MGTGLGSKAVVEVSKDKSVRVDGLIIDSPFHSFEYAFKQMPNFYYYSSFFIDWPKLLDIAGLNANTAEVTLFINKRFMLDEIVYIVKCFKICHIFGVRKSKYNSIVLCFFFFFILSKFRFVKVYVDISM